MKKRQKNMNSPFLGVLGPGAPKWFRHKSLLIVLAAPSFHLGTTRFFARRFSSFRGFRAPGGVPWPPGRCVSANIPILVQIDPHFLGCWGPRPQHVPDTIKNDRWVGPPGALIRAAKCLQRVTIYNPNVLLEYASPF